MVPVVTPRLAGSLAERVPLMGGEGEILPSFSYLLTHNLITALHAPFERARSDRSKSYLRYELYDVSCKVKLRSKVKYFACACPWKCAGPDRTNFRFRYLKNVLSQKPLGRFISFFQKNCKLSTVSLKFILFPV